MSDDHTTPVAYIDDREVAWIQPQMFAAGIYDRLDIPEEGYYILHEDTKCPLIR